MNPDYRRRQPLQMLVHGKAAKHATGGVFHAFRLKALALRPPLWQSLLHQAPTPWAPFNQPTRHMQLTPVIAIHMSAALAAVATGPVALWARKGRLQRPKLHRAFGYTWVTLMVVTALSAVFIRDFRLPNIAGYTPIHLFIPLALLGLVKAFRALARGQIALHQKLMTRTYINTCLIAGVFTFLPGRYLGQLLWSNF